MPIATFAGNRGWGYDGVYTFAPHPAYGGPDGFARLVDAAHAAGLGVILDVVYNHLGAGADRDRRPSGRTHDRHGPRLGRAPSTSPQPAVREWACPERRDVDPRLRGRRAAPRRRPRDRRRRRSRTCWPSSRERVRAIDPRGARDRRDGDRRPAPDRAVGTRRPVGRRAPPRRARTPDRRAQRLLRELRPRRARSPTSWHAPRVVGFVVCAQNHDQVGNRAFGDRLRGPDLRLAAFCVILSRRYAAAVRRRGVRRAQPVPVLHRSCRPRVAELTRSGRRREFAEFAEFAAAEIPDPQDPADVRALQARRRRRATGTTSPTIAGCSSCAVNSPTS